MPLTLRKLARPLMMRCSERDMKACIQRMLDLSAFLVLDTQLY